MNNPFTTLAPVRWKAMKLDKEEAEEEMYMPTDKVFACRPIHVAVTHTSYLSSTSPAHMPTDKVFAWHPFNVAVTQKFPKITTF